MKIWGLLCLVLLAGCEDDFKPVVDIIPAPEEGVQLLFKQITIQPGEDIEFCTYFNLESAETLSALGAKAFDKDGMRLDSPFLLQDMIVNNVDLDAQELAINKIEIVASPGLHHVQLLALENDSNDFDERHIFECGQDLFGGPLTGDVEPLFFTSLPDYAVEYQPGTARILKRTEVDIQDETRTRGPQLLYNFHYLNASDEPIEAEVLVNFHMVDRSTVVHPVRSAWWNFVYFDALPNETVTVDATGSFKVDVNLVGMTSHQHEIGKKFTYSMGGEQIYENNTWAEPDYLTFPANTILAAGEPLDFTCEWFNPFKESRYFGLQADDEMCTAIVEYHPVDEDAAAALLEQLRLDQKKNGGGGAGEGFFGNGVSLENFVPLPAELVEQLRENPDSAVDILNGPIMCGIAANMKEMEEQYGRSPDTLADLQMLVDILGAFCGLE